MSSAADNQGFNDIGIETRNTQSCFDLPAILSSVPTEPDALQHFEMSRAGKPGYSPLRSPGRIDPHAGGDFCQPFQIAFNLRVGNAEIPREGRLVAMERSIRHAR